MRRQLVRPVRRGSLVPAVALAILVIGTAMALVFDRLWIDAAKGELTTAAEAAALAAAGQLATDDLLRPDVESATIVDAARAAGIDIAATNRVAGTPINLDASGDGDIRFGRLVINEDTGEAQFLETNHFPTSVAVRASRTRAVGNPVARLFQSSAAGPGADVEVIVEATINNRVTGFRAPVGGTVPALPMAILDVHPLSDRRDTWTYQVEQGHGPDQLRFDAVTGTIVEGEDGLSEFTLKPMPKSRDKDEINMHIIDIGTELDPSEISRQVRSGWSVADLMSFDGTLDFLGPLSLTATPHLRDDSIDALAEIVGQTRICLLYNETTELSSHGEPDAATLTIRGFVAVRVMRVDFTDEGPIVIVQPAVVATRSAVVADPDGTASHLSQIASPYVYKISLTN
ncbi:MAG: hypothetical protein R3C01_13475 [Planctomycetaceae bacterium]